MLKPLSILALIGAIALPAAAQEKPAEKKVDPDKKICRTVKSTTSRLGGQRECRTKAEWDMIAAQGGEAVRNAATTGR